MAEINGYVDGLGSIKPHGEWYDNVEVHSYYSRQSQDNSYGIMDKKVEIDDGFNLQHIYEAGPVFESLIDHRSWYDLVEYYLGRGTPFMHELFLNVRGPGGYIGVHSGGPRFDGRGWGVSAVPEGEEELEGGSGKAGVEWSVGYMSLIIALRDIGPGDGTQNTRSPRRNCGLRKSPGLRLNEAAAAARAGATVLVPGSHKSMLKHPTQQQMRTEGSLVEGAEEVHLKAGDAILCAATICLSLSSWRCRGLMGAVWLWAGSMTRCVTARRRG